MMVIIASLISLIITVALIYMIYKIAKTIYGYFEPTIRFNQYVNALKIGMVVKTAKDKNIEIGDYITESIESIDKKIEKEVSKAIGGGKK